MPIALTLTATSYLPGQLLTDSREKIVFAGRSNVGKSSLLNAISGRKLAKTSSQPGKTQSVNYYLVADQNWYLVDLPGYGYAKASHSQRQQWSGLLEAFFRDVSGLVAVCVLLDARLPPQDKDLQMIRFVQENGFALLGVLTKADKCTQRELAAKLTIWESILPEPPVVTSAKTKKGLGTLLSTLHARVEAAKAQPLG
ncbi:MAG: YihA family ribosome biogenesis GTP-binding protein [Desulfovibrio sp.]|nr:YihA family ribosome biogenesis GTP-binding protein [Desulfovibrio sp.]